MGEDRRQGCNGERGRRALLDWEKSEHKSREEKGSRMKKRKRRGGGERKRNRGLGMVWSWRLSVLQWATVRRSGEVKEVFAGPAPANNVWRGTPGYLANLSDCLQLSFPCSHDKGQPRPLRSGPGTLAAGFIPASYLTGKGSATSDKVSFPDPRILHSYISVGWVCFVSPSTAAVTGPSACSCSAQSNKLLHSPDQTLVSSSSYHSDWQSRDLVAEAIP